ncbi:50S ribosomal protein L22 [Candidatus Saccharibacteria bacterium]|nr:50S ribosomal protein L22 [Candidatus Saccharibacteria bacterium]
MERKKPVKQKSQSKKPVKAKAGEKTKTTEKVKLTSPAEAFAIARYLKISPTKVRGVLDLIRGETVAEAERVLRFSSKKGAKLALKVLNSAISNAKSMGSFDEKGWVVSDVRADKGPLFRRKLDPKARGARGLITTPSTHLKVVIKQTVATKVEEEGSKRESEEGSKRRPLTRLKRPRQKK